MNKIFLISVFFALFIFCIPIINAVDTPVDTPIILNVQMLTQFLDYDIFTCTATSYTSTYSYGSLQTEFIFLVNGSILNELNNSIISLNGISVISDKMIGNLEPNTTYSCMARAIDIRGYSSNWSSAVNYYKPVDVITQTNISGEMIVKEDTFFNISTIFIFIAVVLVVVGLIADIPVIMLISSAMFLIYGILNFQESVIFHTLFIILGFAMALISLISMKE